MISLNSDHSRNKNHTLSTFVFTIVAMFCLMIIAKPNFLHWFHPEWGVLFIAYWSIQHNSPLNLTRVFIIGLLVDLLMTTPLGEHALIYCIVYFIGNRTQKQIAQLPLWQKSLFILAILIIVLTYQLIVSASVNLTTSSLSLIATTLSSLCVWPIITHYLDRHQQSSL